jgi:hypothetical protein
MRQQAATWRREVLNQRSHDERAYPVGHLEMNLTPLPARDGTSSGKVKRSAKAPNCSYFTNWTTTDDRIMWTIDVLNSGLFDVEVLYTCPKKDVGAEFQLQFGKEHITAKVTEEHDPPARGDDHDRVPRDSESLVKDFKALPAGQIRLEQGRGQLTLQATAIPGSQVMEVRGLILRRIVD